jgi:hypothetical protein
MKNRLGIAVVLASGILLASELSAGDKKTDLPKPPEAFTQMLQCRTLTDDATRLACYDQAAAKLQTAQEKREIVVVDKAEVKEAKKGLFGFTLPQIKLFGGGSGDEEVNEIEFTIASVRQYDYGRWRFTTTDGAVWDQIDTEILAIDPRAGQKVVVKRAAMGSFKAKVGGQPPIRVRRVQ